MKRVLCMRTLQRLIVTFTPEGIEYAVSYQHDASHSKSTSPGMKTRTVQAARMATAGLERALANLKDSEPKWGGFATDLQTSTDKVLIDRKEKIA
jgi:hypothetical protein